MGVEEFPDPPYETLSYTLRQALIQDVQNQSEEMFESCHSPPVTKTVTTGCFVLHASYLACMSPKRILILDVAVAGGVFAGASISAAWDRFVVPNAVQIV